jgi:hypothetical protein
MKSTKSKVVNTFIIGTFVSLYLTVSIISTIHVVEFFRLSNPEWLAISLAIGFELGAAASLAALITLDKMNKNMVWALFIVITGMQMQGNMYYAYTNIKEYQGWVELFNLVEWEPIAQKRLLAGVSGAILPLVALGFIKSLVDYIKPEGDVEPTQVEDLDVIHEEVESMRKVVDSYDSLQEEMDDWERASLEDFVDEDELAGFIPDDNYNIEEEVQLDDYPPIEFDVIDVKDETGLVDSRGIGETRTVGAPEVMTVYDANKRNYVPIKEKNVC